MRPELQRRVQRYGWDKAAAHYEAYWKQSLLPAQAKLLEMADLQPGQRVLEVASGTGLVTLPAARAVGPTGEILATDVSDEMVRATLAAARQEGLDNVVTERMGAEELLVEDASFDVVLCSLGLMYVPDAALALREMLRVLRPGGQAVVAVWGQRSSCGWAEIFPIVDKRVNTEVCPLFFQLGVGDALEFLMRQAGFDDAQSERVPTTLEYASHEDACGAAFLGGPVAMAYSRFDEATREEAHAEYLDSISGFWTDEGYRIPGEFVVTRGTKGVT